MVLSLTYMRPSYVTDQDVRKNRESLQSQRDSVRSGKSSQSAGIPEDASFEKIIAGTTCKPLALRDFMNYLIYQEYSAENLQFYLWYKDYVERFMNAPAADRGLAPEWTKAKEDELANTLHKEAKEKLRRTPAAAHGMFKGTDFEKSPVIEPTVSSYDSNPFSTPPQTAVSVAGSDRDSVYPPSTKLSYATTCRSQASDAFASVGAKSPFTIQPFRMEIDRIISTYIAEDAPRQLNLSDKDRKMILHALSYTTHPSALRAAAEQSEFLLRQQSHPNFVRWSTCNGCPPRIVFARSLGWVGIVGGFVAAVLATLSTAGRGWRAMAAIGWILGIHAVVASYCGMCICMYTFRGYKYHIRPWELFVDAEDAEDGGGHGFGSSSSKASFESFGSSNSFEQEPWVKKYEERNVWRKIFDHEARIEAPILRAIHDTIFIQAGIVGWLSGAALTAIFVALPAGNFF